MKTKKIKLITIFLLVLPLCLVFLGVGCQNDEWEEIILNEKTCGNIVGVLDPFSDYSGTVKNMFAEIGTNTYCIVVTEPETSVELIYIACNLPEQYHLDGLKIKFSGAFLKIKDWVDGEAQSDLLGTPVKLTNAKVKR